MVSKAYFNFSRIARYIQIPVRETDRRLAVNAWKKIMARKNAINLRYIARLIGIKPSDISSKNVWRNEDNPKVSQLKKILKARSKTEVLPTKVSLADLLNNAGINPNDVLLNSNQLKNIYRKLDDAGREDLFWTLISYKDYKEILALGDESSKRLVTILSVEDCCRLFKSLSPKEAKNFLIILNEANPVLLLQLYNMLAEYGDLKEES